MNPCIVRALEFTAEGLAVEYADVTRDVRSNGLAINHTVWIPAEEYGDEIDAVLTAVATLMTEVTGDLDTLGPLEPEPEPVRRPSSTDEDDDDGPDFPRADG
jgi:hypothetical protein